MRFLANAVFFQVPKVARTLCIFSTEKISKILNQKMVQGGEMIS